MKICCKCETEKPYSDFHKHRGHGDGFQAWCKSCRKVFDQAHKHDPQKREWYKIANERRHSNPVKRAKVLYDVCKRRSLERNEPFDLLLSRIEVSLLTGVCERTGVKFSFDLPKETKNNPFSPSIDKIDHSKHYTNDNIQIVVWCYNTGKQQMSTEAYERFILDAADNIRKRRA